MTLVGLGGYGVKDNVALDAATQAKLFAIPFGKRKWGMIVTVYADANPLFNITWFLKYNQSSTNKNDNANWVDATTVFGGGSGSMVLKDRNYDATTGNFPNPAAKKGWVYIVGPGLGGNVGGRDLVEGQFVTANIDNPGNNWNDWNGNQ